MTADDLVDYLEGARVVDLRALSGSLFVIEAQRGDERLLVTARVVEILSPETTTRKISKKVGHKVQKQARGGISLFGQRQHWPLEVLKREGLPLYWNQEWLLQEIERHGSIEAAAKASGYSPQTVNNFAIREFGMQKKPRVDPHLKLKAKELRSQGLTLDEIASRLGISKASVFRAVRD